METETKKNEISGRGKHNETPTKHIKRIGNFWK